jgi:hypothetical protein
MTQPEIDKSQPGSAAVDIGGLLQVFDSAETSPTMQHRRLA